MDCDTASTGCDGGYMTTAFAFVSGNGGIASEVDYGYTGVRGNCKGHDVAYPTATISDYELVPANNETALMQAVVNQPVSITFCDEGPGFRWYAGGVYNGPCSICATHALTVVGYGIYEEDGPDKGTEYWLLKNSWSEDWGVNGFMYAKRNAGNAEGLCGLAKHPSYPTK